MRPRGTAVVIRYGRVLLVRDRGKHRFSLPGGGIKPGEPSVSAAARELREELGLTATKVERRSDVDFKGRPSMHKVCLVQAAGKPHLKGHELDKFIWWDMKKPIPIYPHVKVILRKMGLF